VSEHHAECSRTIGDVKQSHRLLSYA